MGIKQCCSNKTIPERTDTHNKQQFLARNNILTMYWPALSLNYKLRFQLHYSYLALVPITPSIFQSMSCRCAAVIGNNGGHKYY